MFFPRLRRRAKWVFLLLALAFGIGFVAFGVGTGVQGTSLGDVLRDIFGSGGSNAGSIEAAQKKLDENPKDVDAQLELARAYQARNMVPQAIAAYEKYTAARPKDGNALQALAGLYVSGASDASRRAASAQNESSATLFGQQLVPQSTPLGQALAEDPIANAVSSEASAKAAQAGEEARREWAKAASVYERLTLLTPDEPFVYLQLGQSAEFARDYASATAAYKQFLKLVPDDPSAAQVRQELKLIESINASGAQGAGGSG